MSNSAVGRSSRSADLHTKLRLVALGAVALGVMLLAAAAFALSYEGIHQIALRAGVSPELAKLYPLIFDAMLVIAGAATLALRGASWWARFYAWFSLLLMLAAMAVGNAVHAIGTTLPAKPTKAAVAVIPWVLLLMAFGLLLTMLHYFRKTRPAAAMGAVAAVASGSAAADVNGGPRPAAIQAAASGKMRELPRVDLDTLLGPREVPHAIEAGEDTGHQADPVSYGEETGYVHPDSYLDEGEYSPHGDTGGPGGYAAQAGDGTQPARNAAASAESPATGAATHSTGAEAAATGAEPPPASAEPPATRAETSQTPAEPAATGAEPPPASAEPPATTTEPSAADANTPPASAGPSANGAENRPSAAEPSATTAEPPATGTEPATAGAEPPAAGAETPPSATKSPAAAEAAAIPAEAPVGETVPSAANGQAVGGDGAAAETPTTADTRAEAGQGGDGATPEAASAEGSTLQRIRSTPTRPEE